MIDVFDGELLFPLLGDPFKAEPEPEDVPKLSSILDPNKSKVAPSNNQITNIIESDVRVVGAHEQTQVGHWHKSADKKRAQSILKFRYVGVTHHLLPNQC